MRTIAATAHPFRVAVEPAFDVITGNGFDRLDGLIAVNHGPIERRPSWRGPLRQPIARA